MAIINLLKGYHLHCKSNRQRDYKYLICQCIRQYASAPDHYHVSVKAQEFWDKLTDRPIEGYFYRDIVPCNKLLEPINVTKYLGARREGKGDTLRNGDTFIFNDLFQCDHVVPVSIIFKKLTDTPVHELTLDYVDSVLSEMHLCKITKQEDFELGRTRNRYPTFMDTITLGAYKDVPLVEDKFLIEHGYKRN